MGPVRHGFLPELRYEKAHEFIEVCQQLWNSWYEDEVVMDRENGVFADASKVHRIEYQGRFYSSRGPLNVVRSPAQWESPG